MRQILIAFCFLAVALQAHALNTNQQVYIRSGQAYENFMNTYGSHFVKAGTVLAAHITSVGIFAVIQELYGGIRVRKLDLSSMKTVDIHLNDRMIVDPNDVKFIEVRNESNRRLDDSRFILRLRDSNHFEVLHKLFLINTESARFRPINISQANRYDLVGGKLKEVNYVVHGAHESRMEYDLFLDPTELHEKAVCQKLVAG